MGRHRMFRTAYERARIFDRRVRRFARCVDCGQRPIEFHHEEHPQRPRERVSVLVHAGASIARVKQEMRASDRLCRRCHMTRDGRRQALPSYCPNTGKRFCKRGHEFTAANTGTTKAGRYCRECYRQQHRAWLATRKAGAA